MPLKFNAKSHSLSDLLFEDTVQSVIEHVQGNETEAKSGYMNRGNPLEVIQTRSSTGVRNEV
jgi:hypothetical protein